MKANATLMTSKGTIAYGDDIPEGLPAEEMEILKANGGLMDGHVDKVPEPIVEIKTAGGGTNVDPNAGADFEPVADKNGRRK